MSYFAELTNAMFQSALPCEERLRAGLKEAAHPVFQSALPCEERQGWRSPPPGYKQFQSALPCEERLTWHGEHDFAITFQSALPCEERPHDRIHLSDNCKPASSREPLARTPGLEQKLESFPLSLWFSNDLQAREHLRNWPDAPGSREGVRHPRNRRSSKQRAAKVKRRLSADVLDPPLRVGTEEIKSQAVMPCIDCPHQASTQCYPLGRVDFALKNRIRHALTKILAGTSDPAKPPLAGRRRGTNIVGNQH
jgi:hypothetical protein